MTCSKSLAELYSKDGLNFNYIRNGIDVEKYNVCTNKKEIRKRQGLCDDTFIFIYTGQFIKRKNIDFILDNFVELYKHNDRVMLLLLGDGPELVRLKTKYKQYDNIRFLGRKTNVDEYLYASDVYLSASKSEGLPNGVLEALSCGLPVLLSDIPQHREILDGYGRCGYSFSLNDSRYFKELINRIVNHKSIHLLSAEARRIAETNFSSIEMSSEYQNIYCKIMENNPNMKRIKNEV